MNELIPGPPVLGRFGVSNHSSLEGEHGMNQPPPGPGNPWLSFVPPPPRTRPTFLTQTRRCRPPAESAEFVGVQALTQKMQLISWLVSLFRQPRAMRLGQAAWPSGIRIRGSGQVCGMALSFGGGADQLSKIEVVGTNDLWVHEAGNYAFLALTFAGPKILHRPPPSTAVPCGSWFLVIPSSDWM